MQWRRRVPGMHSSFAASEIGKSAREMFAINHFKGTTALVFRSLPHVLALLLALAGLGFADLGRCKCARHSDAALPFTYVIKCARAFCGTASPRGGSRVVVGLRPRRTAIPAPDDNGQRLITPNRASTLPSLSAAATGAIASGSASEKFRPARFALNQTRRKRTNTRQRSTRERHPRRILRLGE